MSDCPPLIPRCYEVDEDPNFFYILIPGTSQMVNISVKEIQSRGLDYLDEIAEEIDNYIFASDPIILVRHEIDKGVKVFGGQIFYFARIPNEKPQIFMGSKNHPNIQGLDRYYFQ
jgi:hypothetical protein